MDDAQRMHVSNTDDNLLNDASWLFLTQMFSLFNELKKILARTKLSDDVHVGFCLKTGFELHKEGMTKYLHDAALMSIKVIN